MLLQISASLVFVLCKLVKLLALRERQFTVRFLGAEDRGPGFVATSPANKISNTT